MSDIFDEVANSEGDIFDEVAAVDTDLFDEVLAEDDNEIPWPEEDEEKKPGFFAKAIDIGKEFTGGVADIAKSIEAEHRRRSRKADKVGFGLDLRVYNKEERARLKAKKAELKKSGLSKEEQKAKLKELQKEIQVGMIREQAQTGMETARKVQETMPQPELAEDAGFLERSARGIIRSAPAMAATAVTAPAGAFALFHIIRGSKLEELEQKKAHELKGIKDSWQRKEIEEKYNDQKNIDTATLNAVLSTPVEYFGTVLELGFLTKALKRAGAGSRLKSFLVNMSKNSATEGFEEWVQTHTELIADKFGMSPDKSGSEIWTEVNDEFWTWKHQGEAAMAAAQGMAGAGMMMGAPAGAVNIAQSIEEKARLSDLTSEQRGRLNANPLLTADDIRNEGKVSEEKAKSIAEEKEADAFGALEEDIQVTEDSTAMNSGIGERGAIILEEKLRTEAEQVEAARTAREQAKKAEELKKQQEAETTKRLAEEEAQKAAEAKRKAELEAQEQFELVIAARPGLIKQSIQAVAALENSGDPNIRKAVAPIRKAQAALATREDSAKRLMTIQNDLRVEMQRVRDPRSQALMIRLDEEIEREVSRIDALVAAKEVEAEAKKIPVKEPAKAPQKYDEYKTKAPQTAAARAAARSASAKKQAAIEKTKEADKIAKTKEAIAKEKKRQIAKAAPSSYGVKYQIAPSVAGQISDETIVAGTKFGETVKRVAEGKPVRQTLSKVAKQGKSFYVDVMHPSKIGARIYKQQREEGMTPSEAKVAVTHVLDNYGPVYDQVAAKFLKIVSPEKMAEGQAVAVDTEGIKKEVTKSLQRAKINLQGLTGIKVVHKSTDLEDSNPVMYNNMKAHDTHGQANALFDPDTRQIYVFTENADSVVKAKQAVWHELGHFSLDELLGDELNPVLKMVSEKYKDRVEAKLAAGYPTPALATEEVLIDMFTKNETNTAIQKFKNLWDRFIQKIGFHKGEINERDVRSLIAKIRKNLAIKKIKPAEVKRIKKIAYDAWQAQVQDLGTPQAKYLIDEVKWTVAQDKAEFGTVNNRMQKELEVFEKLFGKSEKASMMPGKIDVKTYKRPITRTITARDMGEELERVRKDGTLKRYLDPKVPAETIAKERGLKGKEKLHFLTEIKDLRSGPLYVSDEIKIDKKVVSSNDKAGMSLDFWLGTCQPTQPCKECYAATAYFRMSAVKKSFRNTAYILTAPKLWAKKVAAEIKAVPQTKIPFIRLLGSGDMTFSEQVTGFNELAKVADRPIHIFSRHHDNLRKLKGTAKVPFMRMGSVDAQLFDHYGMKYLEENGKKYGIANAFLYTDKQELPKINKLIDKDALGLILSADTKLHKTLTPKAQAASCPCDAGERGAFGSCRMCAMSEAGCFMGFAAKGFDNKGKIWDLTDSKKPKDTMPFTMFLRDAQAKPGLPKIVQAYSEIAVDAFSKSMTYAQQQILWFGQGKQVDMKMKDIRYPEQVTRTKDVKIAEAWKENLRKMRDEAKEGTFTLPSGEIQPTVAFEKGKPIKYDRTMFKSRREYAAAKKAELAKFRVPEKPRTKFRSGKIAFTKQEQVRRVIKQKDQVKALIIGGIQKGVYTGAVRFAPMADINQIIKDGEIKTDLHATPILGKDYDAIPAYGDNTKIPSAMVVPNRFIKPKPEAHTNEAYIKAGTPLSEITFIFPTGTKNAKAVRVPKKETKYSIKSPAFKKWFGKSVVNEKGKPITIYHGTTHDFSEFDPSNAYLQNFLGRSLYFTDNPADASTHYGTVEGADLQARIGYAQDGIINQLEQMDEEQVSEYWGITVEEAADVLVSPYEHPLVKEMATKEVAGQSLGSVMPVYVRIERPMYMNGPKETQLTIEPDWKYYEEQAADDIDKKNYAAIEDYESDLRERAEELYMEDSDPLESGNGIDFKNAFFEVADDWGEFEPQEVWNAMREDTNFEYEVSASDMILGIIDHTKLQELYDPDTGDMANREFLREWIERAGYDGAVLHANPEFPGMFMGQPPTMHYMPFKGNQVKSVFNMGDWSPVVADIRYSRVQLEDAELKGVAFKYPKTGEVMKGEPGDMHSDILRKNFGHMEDWPAFDDYLDMGYITKAGKFINRTEVAKLMKFDSPAAAESLNLEQWDKLKYSKVTPDQQKALDHIGLREGKKKDSNLLEMSWFERNIISRGMDSLYALKKMGAEAGYKSFNMLSNFPAMFSTFLNNGRVQFQDGWMVVTPEADGGLFTVQQRLGDTADNFFKRLTAKSGKEILDRDAATVASGKPSRFKEGVNLFGKDFTTGELLNDRKMVKDLLAGTVIEYRANKELWDWAENRLKELNTSVLDMAEKSNLIDPAARKKFEREYYVPFFRIMEDMEGDIETMFPKTGDPTHIAKLHKLAGSHKNVGDPFNNLVNNYSFILHESLKNMARGKSLNVAKQMGLIKATTKAGKDVVGVRVKGQETMYKVLDPMLYNALVDVDTITNGWMSEGLGKWLLRKPKLWLTKFVTYDPSFRIANFLRDTLHTSFMQKGFVPIFSSLRGGYHALFQTPEFKEFASTGGAFTGAYHERDTLAKTFEEIERVKKRAKRGKRAAYNPMSWLDLYRKIGEAGENAARMGVYQLQKKQGKSSFEAAYAAKDLLDFHRSGSSGLLGFLTQTVPFMNARLQGLYKVGRVSTDVKTRKNFWLMSTILAAATSAYFFSMSDDDKERYDELTDSDKLMYYHFFNVPGLGHVKVPKPFEVGTLFSSFPESFMDYLYGRKDGKALGKFVYHAFRDIFAMNPMPQAAKPLLQQWANRDAFTGAPIVPPGEQKLAADLQYGERTSKIARMTGAQLQKFLGDNSKFASPRRIQKLFEDYFSYGTYLSSYLSDQAIQYFDAYPEDPATRDGEGFSRLILGSGRFIKGKSAPKYTRSQQEFYEMLQETTTATSTFRAYRKLKERAKAKGYRTAKKPLLRAAKKLSRWQRKVSQLNLKIDLIIASRKYNAEEKREKIDKLILRKQDIFKKAVTWYNRGKQ